MASQFNREVLKIVVSQLCQTVGFNGIYSAPLHVLIDLLHLYLHDIASATHRYAEHSNRTIPNLDDLTLTFKEMGISLSDLEEYITYVEPIAFPHEVPKIPISRQSDLNFLKPGAREILSRPLFIHEHLPPMYPEKEEEDVGVNGPSDNMEGDDEDDVTDKPSSAQSGDDSDLSPNKKIKLSRDEEGEPVREIDSVMMTTSGFISSAREGKMPEGKRPNIPMALPRSSSPVSGKNSSLNKKKATMEKIIRHKHHHGGIIAGSLIHSNPKESKLKPKFNSAPPGTGSFPKPAVLPPKLKIPTPTMTTMKVESLEQKTLASVEPQPQQHQVEKIKKKEKDGKRSEKSKDRKKDKESKKDRKDDKREKNKDREKRERERERMQQKQKERTRIRMKGLTREEELQRYKERENELIAALAASSAVTVTSIPPPSLRVREKTPELSAGSSTPFVDSKSKLNIFKKVLKGKDSKEPEEHQSREASPMLMIAEIKEEPKSPPQSPVMEPPSFHEEPALKLNSPPESLHAPTVPKTPDVPPVKKNKRGRPHKIKSAGSRESPNKSPKVKSTLSPEDKSRSRVIHSPTWRSPIRNPIMDRPKTPEGKLSSDEITSPVTPFAIPSFPNAPGFIPPFSRFSFSPPYGIPPQGPSTITPLPLPLPDPMANMFSRPLIITKKEMTKDDNQPPPPSHESIFISSLHAVHRKDVVPQELPPVPPPTKLTSPKPNPRPTSKAEKPQKQDKEKKKEHKKEKKEKDKVKKKKEKKDKEKAKEEKKKEKERLKQEKKEKKKQRTKKSSLVASESVPKITFKLPTDSSNSGASSSHPKPKVTPKLVIKPVVKHSTDDAPPPAISVDESKKRPAPLSPPVSPVTIHRTTIKLPPETAPGSPPEIAKFSALITRPPKGSQSKKKPPSDVLPIPPLKIKDPGLKIGLCKKDITSFSVSSQAKAPKETVGPVPSQSFPPLLPSLKIKNAGGFIPLKILPEKKSGSKKSEKKEAKKNLLITTHHQDVTSLRISPEPSSSAPCPIIPEILHTPPPKGSRKSTTIVQSPSIVVSTSTQPQPSTVVVSAVTKPTSGLVTETVGPIGHFVDDQGNEVWICPTCGKQDDGSPMIGCDTCDDWYHWLCVGIHVPPSEKENWYCPRCLSQHKQKGIGVIEKKKRGRKRKIPLP